MIIQETGGQRDPPFVNPRDWRSETQYTGSKKSKVKETHSTGIQELPDARDPRDLRSKRPSVVRSKRLKVRETQNLGLMAGSLGALSIPRNAVSALVVFTAVHCLGQALCQSWGRTINQGH